jgi:ribosome-binding protein aMBF1 (putative translation factor)
MKVKFKTTADGDVAIVPRAEYERLKALEQETKEDAGTVRLVAQARNEIAGGAPLLPKEVVDRLAKGENPIRVLRQFRGLSQIELAATEEVGITQNYLSDLETGKRKGPLALHRKFARALGVPLDLLATIAVSEAEADPARTARRKQVIADIKRQRGQK